MRVIRDGKADDYCDIIEMMTLDGKVRYIDINVDTFERVKETMLVREGDKDYNRYPIWMG